MMLNEMQLRMVVRQMYCSCFMVVNIYSTVLVISLSCRLVKQLFLPQVRNNITGNRRIHSFKLSFKRLSSPTLFSF